MEASTAVSSRLIGAFFVEKGLVTQEQLEHALHKQEQSGERLGEIIVAEFGVSRLELASVLAEQWAEFERDTKARDAQAAPEGQSRPAVPEPVAAPVEPQLRRPIGEIFLERGFVNAADLEKALDVQRQTGARLGEVLVEQGSLSRLDLASALAEQWSTLQKLRPPEPVEPQPWQNGAPAATVQGGIPSELQSSIDDLGRRVRAVEQAAAASPWNEDLRLLGENVRAAIATVEERVTKTATRVDPEQLDALGAALDELRERVEAPVSRLDAVERRLGELPSLEELEARLEERLAELRASVTAPAADAVPSDELVLLRERLDEVARHAASPDELEELRTQVAALAGALPHHDIESLRATVDELSGRVASADDLVALQARLDEVARHVESPAALAEIRAEMAELARATTSSDDVAALGARVEELAAGAAALDDLAALRARVEELAVGAAALDDLAALRARVEELAAGAAVAGDLAALREAVDELSARTVSADDLRELRARLDELGTRIAPETLAEATGLAEVRAELAALASRPAAPPESVEELRARVDALAGELAASPAAARDEVASLAARVEDLSALQPRLDELAERVSSDVSREEHEARIRELLERVDAIGNRVESIDMRNTEPSGPRLREILDGLRAEIGSLAERPVVDVDLVESRLLALEQSGLDDRVETLATSIEEQRSRIDARLDELVSRLVDPVTVAELRERMAEVTDSIARAAEADAVEARLEELERRLSDTSPLDRLREELGGMVVAAAGERASAEQALRSQIEEIARSVPATEDVGALRARVDELASLPGVGDELRSRLDELSGRVEQALAAVRSHDELRQAVEHLRASHESESGAAAGRFAGLESALSALEGMEWRLQTQLEESVAVRAGELEHRIVDATRRLDTLQGLEERLDTLRAELDARPDSLHEVAAELRAEIERIADAGQASRDEVRGSIAEHAAAVAAELEAIRRASAEREHALEERLAGFVDRSTIHELDERLADHDRKLADTGLSDQVAGLAAELRDRGAGLEHGLGEVWHAVESARAEAAERLEASSQALRHELDGRDGRIHERLAVQEGELVALRARLEELHAETAGQDEWRREVESGLDARVSELDQRIASQASETRVRVERAEQSLVTEVGSLGGRLDELLGLRQQDLQAARAASDTLAARVDELHALRAADAETAQAAAGELAAHVEGLAASLRTESAAARSAAEQVARRVGELEGLRADDLEAARIAGAELVARLDDLAIRTAAAAAEADRALRTDLYALAATVEEKDAAGIEARDDLRLELERAASSIGWRLERIEQALASDDAETLRAAVDALESRLEQQIAVQDEQVRVTERALRKGLASLGERLADTQTAYLDAGNALRRSIERLGAAVVEADARMADQIPVSDVEGYVAFAPTSEGYRLVQVPGAAPDVGATVAIDGIDGPLVVTRFGRSPLPLDSRPCAYLDRLT